MVNTSTSKKEKVKLGLIYLSGIIFTLYLKKNFLNKTSLGYESMVVDNLLLSIIFSVYLFFWSVFYDCNNIVDLSYGTTGLVLIMDSFVDDNKRGSFFTKYNVSNNTYISEIVVVIASISLILMYSIRHILIYFRSGVIGFESSKEDFRYQKFRSKFTNKYLFWAFSLISLHMIPVLMLTLGYQPIFEALSNIRMSGNLIYIALSAFILANIAILFETVADEQLFLFKTKRGELMKNSELVGNKVLNFGLWRKVRHPNYFGEVLYFFSLALFSFGVSREINLSNTIGFIIMLCLFLFYSVPAMEAHLLAKYKEEYKAYQLQVKHKLIPLIY